MKLLVLTQKMDLNDGILGFFIGWIQEFAKQCERVTVICLYKGEYELPDNVKVLSLGKEGGASRLKYLINFYKYLWQERRNYDLVFVHMNQIYVILGAPFWRLWRKKIGLWYAHGDVSASLKLAEKFTDLIFTSTKEGCRLNSEKIRIIGQGINLKNFQFPIFPANGTPLSGGNFQKKDSVFKITTIGRISPTKDYETLIGAAEILAKENFKFKVQIIGGPGSPEQEKYLADLKGSVKDKGLADYIEFVGNIPNDRIGMYLQDAGLFVNMSQTGSLDKAILEAMATGLPVATSNEAASVVLSAFADKMVFPQKDFQALAERIKFFINLPVEERIKYGEALRKIVETEHGLEGLIEKIIKNYA